MSFKDLAKIEGYDLDAMEAELKAARARIAKSEEETRGFQEIVNSCHIAEITQENSKLKQAVAAAKARIAEMEAEKKELKNKFDEFKAAYGVFY